MKRIMIRPDEYRQIGDESDGRYSLQLSQYDIPREISVDINPFGVLHVNFQYVDDEHGITRNINDHLTMKVGRHSGKILGFELDTKHHDAKQSIDRIIKAIQTESHHVKRFNERANYKLISSVLDKNLEPLLAY